MNIYQAAAMAYTLARVTGKPATLRRINGQWQVNGQ